MFLSELQHIVTLIIHVLGVLVAVGAVTVTDYLHVVGLRNRRTERKLLFVYPLLGKLIMGSLAIIILSGTVLLVNKPELLFNSYFQLKLVLVAIVLCNGFILHKKVFPEMVLCVEGKKKFCSKKVLLISSFSGSVSLVTWYAIVILALTKKYGYNLLYFIETYLFVLLFLFCVVLVVESRERKWK